MYVTSVCQCQCHQCDNDFSVSQCVSVSDTAYPVIWNSQPEISGTSILPAINMNIAHLTLLTFDTSHLMIHKERLSVTNIWEFILAGTNEGTCSESMRPFCWLMWCQSEKGWSDLVWPKRVNKSATWKHPPKLNLYHPLDNGIRICDHSFTKSNKADKAINTRFFSGFVWLYVQSSDLCVWLDPVDCPRESTYASWLS